MAGTQGKIFKAGLLANLHSVTSKQGTHFTASTMEVLLIQSKTTCLGMVLPMVGQALLN